MPVALKRLLCSCPFQLLSGKAYRQTFERGYRFEQTSREETLAYQEQSLKDILNFATAQSPAYRPYRNAVKRFRPFDALKEFPILTKDMLQEKMRKYLPRDFDLIPHYECTTGGTSGNQLKFYVDDDSQSIETAFMHRQWRRVGYTPQHKKATFRGVPFPKIKSGVYWQYNPIYNEMQFSPFHMSEANLGEYVEQIVRFSPSFMHGYPSAIDILAEYVLRHELTERLPKIEAALLGSEGTTTFQKERIEQAFRTRVYTWYGHSERLILAGECEKNCTYHHFPDYGILEIIDDDGNSCNNEGERGVIVGTTLLNRSLPLIRYQTGDYATCCESHCECGRNWDRFTNVEGRWEQDMIIGRSGAQISVAALNMHGPLFENVRRYQYVQEEEGVCTLNIMTTPFFDSNDRIAIEKAYTAKTGDEIMWSVQEVDDIPLTNRGKLRLLRSSITTRG